MGSIDEVTRCAIDFHDRHLVSSGEKPSAFPLGPEPLQSSYFESPRRASMQPQDFDLSACDSVSDLIAALRAFWAQAGLPQLVDSLDDLSHLAERVQAEASSDDDDDVSPFIYAMY